MQTDRDLQNLAAEIKFLPELARDWEDEAAINRLDWHTEWWELMGRLEAIRIAYHDGGLSDEQAQHYRTVMAQLREAVPVVRRLGFPLPESLLVDVS